MKDIVERIKSWNRKRLKRHRQQKGEKNKEVRKFLAVMCIAKNEGMNIDEWIKHYLWQGADHIFIIDNGSIDDTRQKVELWAENNNVTLISRPQNYKQAAHYKYVFQNLKLQKKFQWLLIADADEFWFSPTGQVIPEVIRKLSSFDLIYCNWSIFGSSECRDHPTSLRENLVHRAPKLGPHEFSKWVAKTDALNNGRSIGIHRIGDICSTRTITENDDLRVNHYVTQSEEFWKAIKMTRGDAFDPANDGFRTMEVFHSINRDCTVEDCRLAQQVTITTST